MTKKTFSRFDVTCSKFMNFAEIFKIDEFCAVFAVKFYDFFETLDCKLAIAYFSIIVKLTVGFG